MPVLRSQTAQQVFEAWEKSQKRLNKKSSPEDHRKVRFQAHRYTELVLEEALQRFVPDPGIRSLLKTHAGDAREIISRLDKGY